MGHHSGVRLCARALRTRSAHAGRTIADGFRRLDDAAARWNEITASPTAKETALALLRRYPLRAADSLRLAAATIARQERGAAWEFVCADKNLVEAAIKEGFAVIAPGMGG